MNVLVTGSTTWGDRERMRQELAALPADTHIIVGDTAGVDALAIEIAHELGFTYTQFAKNAADRARSPGAAWQALNQRMLDCGVQLVLAFHPEYGMPGHARGTVHVVELAQQRGIAVRVFRA